MGDTMVQVRGLAFLVCAGCIGASNTPCGPLICPSTDVCSSDQQCVSPDQITACVGSSQGALCVFGDAHGFCHDGTCVVSLSTCGDGVTELALGELCDCGTSDDLQAPPAGCIGFNSNDPGATCRPDCQPARCGDSILDPSELCDDGNTISGDGCRADCQGPFEKMQTPTGNALRGVATLSSSNAYAVGFAGTVIHYDGHAWSNVSVPTSADLIAIWAISPTDIYVGGGSPSSANLIHFDGSSWASVPVSATDGIGGIWASSANDVYLISESFLPAQIEHFDGTTWSTISACASGSPRSIAGTSASNVYIATNNGLCWFNGSTWSVIYGDAALVAAVSATEVVSIGSLIPASVRRWTGSTPTVTTSVPGFVLGAGATTSADDLLAVGTDGLVLQLSGSQWTHLVTPTEVQLEGVSATSSTNVFIVGNSGTVLH